MKIDIYDLSAEINGISMIIAGLSSQLDNTNADSLTIPSLMDALFGVSRYLARIADDLIELDNSGAKKSRGRYRPATLPGMVCQHRNRTAAGY